MDAILRWSGERTLGMEGLWHDEDLRKGSLCWDLIRGAHQRMVAWRAGASALSLHV